MADNNYAVPSLHHRLHPSIFHPVLRQWQEEGTAVQAHQLIYPVFVCEGEGLKIPIGAMPDMYRFSVDFLLEHLEPLVPLGLQAILLFGVVTDDAKKDATGSFATDPNTPVIRAVKAVREKFPTILVCCDVCLCGYTSHGHCGVLKDDGSIHNQRSIDRLADMSLEFAKAGCQVIAPSDMMDGRILAIKKRLQSSELEQSVSVMSYSAKFASSFYGPFRDAASSGAKHGDRKCYQLPPGARGMAHRALRRDLEEGADIVMVKPATAYMDIISIAKEMSHVPVACYHVSGEYAMLMHAANAGALDLKSAAMEQLQSLRRAGADILITYLTPRVLGWLNEGK